MGKRYGWAVAAVDTNDVFELCRLLAYAAKEAMEEKNAPHNDPAVRLIAHHVAFALNGDLPHLKFYQDTYAYCARMAEREANGLDDEQTKEKDSAPVYSPS